MLIDKLQIGLTEKELNIAIGRFLSSDLPLENVSVSLINDQIKLSGNAVKVVKVPFSAWMKISAKGSSKLQVKIVKVDAVGPVGNMLRSLILSVIIKILPSNIGARSYGNRVRCNVDKLLAALNIETRIIIDSIKIEDGLFKIILSGIIETPKFLEKYLEPSNEQYELNA